MTTLASDPIRLGRDYETSSGKRPGIYRPVAFVVDFPSYQQKVLVRACSGPDEGLLLCCSLWNFCLHYSPLPDEPRHRPEKTAGHVAANEY